MAQSGGSFDLSRMIDPVDVKTFEHDYWEQQPLLVQRDDPDYYADLLTLDDVDRLLTLSGPHFDNIRVVVNGKETTIQELVERGKRGVTNALEAVYDHYRGGSTVVLNALDDRWEPLQRLTNALGAEVNAGFQVNVYLTPGGNAQGFNPHYDTHDVFVAQAYGSKRWRLYESAYQLPLSDRLHRLHKKPDGYGEPVREIVLNAGDLLYLPRGTVHAASTNDTASVHLTVGVHQVLWASVIHDTLGQVFADDVRFRSGLPMGFAGDPDLRKRAEDTLRELLGVVTETLSAESIVADTVADAMSLNTPALRGHLRDLEQLEQIGPDTALRRRANVQCHVSTTDSLVRLNFHNKTVDLPVQVAHEVGYVASTDGEFTPAGIPGGLDAAGRLVLVRTFLREGLLTFADRA